jgi:hypothetical protein
MSYVKALLSSRAALGVLARDMTVRLLEVSRSGCLLESSSQVAIGTLGALSVDVDGIEYVDQVRVVRCQPLAGAGNTHRLGAEFLSMHPPGDRSLRRYAAGLAPEMSRVDQSSTRPDRSGESGSTGSNEGPRP